ncbi:MAG: 3'-5' exonuclease [Cyclobacteriaceae bacterium]
MIRSSFFCLIRYKKKTFSRAALHAEFGKIIVIGLGFITGKHGRMELRLKSLAGDDEKQLLQQFIEVLKKFDPEKIQLCAHNGRSFDFPYLSRRILINELSLPDVLRLSGKKPWEINHLDTMELWRFGDYRHYTSLDLLASIFDIPTSKMDMDGSQVGNAYHEDHDLEGIARYCLKDVEVTARIYLRLTEEYEMEFDVVYTD